MQTIDQALLHIARQFIDTQDNDIQIRRDVIILPAGDGAAIAFPFDDSRDMHITFACELLRLVSEANKTIICEDFREHGWCNCHSGFLLRCGISQGSLILYKDLNENYNIAGDTVNMAARIMDLADANQIFLTHAVHNHLVDFDFRKESDFRLYSQVRIKHDILLDVYQYIDKAWPGIDILPRAGLESIDEPQIHSDESQPALTSEITREMVVKPSRSNVPDPATINISKKIRDRLVKVPGGQFVMGNEQMGEVLIKVNSSFLIDPYVITQEDYLEVMGRNPSKFIGTKLPVDSVTWIDAVAFCNKLSELSKLEPAYDLGEKEANTNYSSNGYRLPTEAEWEYCCRAGSSDERYGVINEIAWYSGNSDGTSHQVATKLPNAFGLYDTLGNVWEWCNDWYQRRYPKDQQVNYRGPDSGFERVLRGGSWGDLPDCIRASFRHRKSPLSNETTHGFRLMLPLSK
jgi:formylglycine-generating enzyme required for sulfatase activity